MVKTTVKMTGLRELGERMKGLSEEMNLKIARSATGAAANVIKKLAVAKAPIAAEDYVVEGLPVKKGNLPKNIVAKRIKPSDTPLTSEHIVTVRGKRKYGYASLIGALQEYGTVKMQPQPFMRPAFDQGKEDAVEAMRKRIDLRLTKAGA